MMRGVVIECVYLWPNTRIDRFNYGYVWSHNVVKVIVQHTKCKDTETERCPTSSQPMLAALSLSSCNLQLHTKSLLALDGLEVNKHHHLGLILQMLYSAYIHLIIYCLYTGKIPS